MKEKRIVKKKELINPIKDNRLVSDYTFAVRLKSFLNQIYPADQMSEEELDYLKEVANKLLIYQMATVVDQDEKDYFENLGWKI